MNTTTANATQPIYRWNGKYYGFMSNGYLLDANGTYRGWIDGNGTVWQANGKFLGDLVGGEYVLLQQSAKRQPTETPDPQPRNAPTQTRRQAGSFPSRRLHRWPRCLRITGGADIPVCPYWQTRQPLHATNCHLALANNYPRRHRVAAQVRHIFYTFRRPAILAAAAVLSGAEPCHTIH